MARLMSVHRSGVSLAYLLDFGKGGDGPRKVEEGNSGADVTSLPNPELNTQNVSAIRALEQPLKFETASLVSLCSLQTI